MAPPLYERSSWIVYIIQQTHWLVRLASSLALIAGFVLSNKLLHTHEECDMTYSRRQFLPLKLQQAPFEASSYYRLYKFMDQRDARYKNFVNHKDSALVEPLEGIDWCVTDNETTVAVLYIPGHGGSYQQARSLGAHGIQLTGAQDRLQQRRFAAAMNDNQWSGGTSDTTIHDFIFDVYAVDFGEEGGALHGDLILQQSRFVGAAVLKLVQDCGLDSVVLFGHSMGGLSAQLVSTLVPETRPYIRNIVTMATPHAGAWLPSLRHLQDLQTAQAHGIATLSIAGGIRDEMIAPEACYLNSSTSTSIMATDIMQPRSSGLAPSLGMDHRAIVWCHNLLLPVRQAIFTLVQTDREDLPAPERVAAVQEALSIDPMYDFLDAAAKMKTVLRNVQGTLQAMVMEAALLSNVELLVIVYAYIGAWRCVTSRVVPGVGASALVPLLAIVNCALFIESTVSLATIAILAFSADALLALVKAVLRFSMREFWSPGTDWVDIVRRVAFLFVLTACGAQVLYGSVGFLNEHRSTPCMSLPLFALTAFIFTPVIVLALTLSLERQTNSLPSILAFVDGAAWIVVVLPLLVAGEVYFIFVRGSFSSTAASVLILKVVPVVLRLVLGYGHAVTPVKSSPVLNPTTSLGLQMARVFLVLCSSPFIFKSGGSYFVGHVLAALCVIDSIEMASLLVDGRTAAAVSKIE